MSKTDSSLFVKREMPIVLPVNCERTNLFSVKGDLDPPSLYHPLTRRYGEIYNKVFEQQLIITDAFFSCCAKDLGNQIKKLPRNPLALEQGELICDLRTTGNSDYN